MKICTVVIIYSILITTIIIIGVIYFRADSYKKTSNLSGVSTYLLTEQNMTDAYKEGSIIIDGKQIINSNDIGTAYVDITFEKLPFLVFIFSIIIMVTTFLLLSLLQYIQNKDAAYIVDKLSTFDSEDSIRGHSFITGTYNNIKEKFDRHMEDYKRLNSYLSHDQKNAIAILRAKLELTEDKEYIRYLDNITDNIDDILTLSDNSDVANLEQIDVGLVCAIVCDDYNKLSNKIIFNFNEDVNTMVLAKERWIYRAVSNLLDNAVKYGNNSLVELSVNNIHHSVIITVKDHGIGIDPSEYDKIFDNHYRLSTLKKDGYGIGLSVVSHVCDLCSGFCWVESAKEEGATFTLSFPEIR